MATATATATATGSPAPAPTAEAEPDECVLCCYPLSLKLNEYTYKSCCGEIICNGCILAQQRTLIIGTNVKKPIKGSKEEERECMTILLSELRLSCVCPFCRSELPTTDTEVLKRFYKQIDKYKDPTAMNKVGIGYLKGKHGLTKKSQKSGRIIPICV